MQIDVNLILDATGATDMTAQMQSIINMLTTGSTLEIPKGTYKISSSVNLKDNIILNAASDVIFIGIGNNTLFNTANNNTFRGIEFQKCFTAINATANSGLKIHKCRFTNNINYSAVNLYGSKDCTITDSYLYNIIKHGVMIDNDSSGILIDNNTFDNPLVYAGYAKEQISAHVYCLNASNVIVSNNIIKNNGGEGIIFAYNSTTGKGTTNSQAINNHCEGNGQEGITSYGGVTKLTHDNAILGNTCINNRFNQIEIWQSDNNIVKNNTVQENIAGIGNLGAITLFNTKGTICKANTVVSAENNGIAIVAGTYKCMVLENIISDTNKGNDISTPQRGNAILLDWNGVADPQYISIIDNIIGSTGATINKSGIYSTSNTNHHNAINGNTITGYATGVHSYALATCGV